jgi:hypothetical protein
MDGRHDLEKVVLRFRGLPSVEFDVAPYEDYEVTQIATERRSLGMVEKEILEVVIRFFCAPRGVEE